MQQEKNLRKSIWYYCKQNRKMIFLLVALILFNIGLLFFFYNLYKKYQILKSETKDKPPKKPHRPKDLYPDRKQPEKDVLPEVIKCPIARSLGENKEVNIWNTPKDLSEADTDLELLFLISMCRTKKNIVCIYEPFETIFLYFRKIFLSINCINQIPESLDPVEKIFDYILTIPLLMHNGFITNPFYFIDTWSMKLDDSAIESYVLMLNNYNKDYLFFGPILCQNIFLMVMPAKEIVIYAFYQFIKNKKIIEENKVIFLNMLDKKYYFDGIDLPLSYVKENTEKYKKLFFVFSFDPHKHGYVLLELEKNTLNAFYHTESERAISHDAEKQVFFLKQMLEDIYCFKITYKKYIIFYKAYNFPCSKSSVANHLKSIALNKRFIPTKQKSIIAKMLHELIKNKILYNE
ncbi:hypothetical protein NUSPORA_00407 [Nucleospora cyclopteri]